MAITVKPTGSVVGAEIQGVDLSNDLNERDFTQINAAFAEYSVVFFRDQKITAEQHIRFSRRFGDLEIHMLGDKLLPGHPEIIVISNIVENGRLIGVADAGSNWHTDLSYMPKPSRCSVMHALEIPQRDGKALGSTLFAGSAAAYDTLPQTLKDELAGLKAYFRYKRIVKTREDREKMPDVIHPIIRTHPVTGRKCIYANQGPTIEIVGFSASESQALLEPLFEHATRSQFLYQHEWRVGDVLMWDNCSSQHRAIFDYALPQRRLMHRTTVAGTVPF